MNTHADDGRARELDAVLGLVRTRTTAVQRDVLERFVVRYFGQVDPEDLAERAPADLYGAALSHWNFARKREPGHARVRVFNPTIEEHGWQSTHTIIEIVNDDMPFLVDSVTMEVNRHGLTLHLIIHPIVAVAARRDGTLTDVAPDGAPDARRESFIHVEVDRRDGARAPRGARRRRRARARRRARGGRRLEEDAGQARSASSPRSTRARRRCRRRSSPKARRSCPGSPTITSRSSATAATTSSRSTAQDALQDRPGIEPRHPARRPEAGRRGELRRAAAGGARVRARPELLIITKSTRARPCIGRAISTTSPSSASTPRATCAASTASSASSRRPRTARTRPTFRCCGARRPTSSRAPAWRRGSHAGKALLNILATYPRDELFQTREDDLLRTAMGILHLGERQRFRLFVRRDPFERFLVCLIYAPRENYTTELRQKWQAILHRGVQRHELRVQRAPVGVGAGAHHDHRAHDARARFPHFDVRELEARLALAARRWDDDLKEALIDALGEARGNELFRQFGDAFPAGYREDFAARAAVPDIEMMARLSAREPLGMSLYRPLEAEPGMLRFKLFHLGAPVTLSDSLPMLERMGLKVLDERPHRMSPPDQRAGLDARLRHADAARRTPTSRSTRCTRCSRMRSAASSAARSRTTTSTGWWSRRACPPPRSSCCARMRSTCARSAFRCRSRSSRRRSPRTPTSRAISSSCSRRASIPDARRAAMPTPRRASQEIEAALEGVENLSEDRVLRQFLALILATTRTNFWRRDAQGGRARSCRSSSIRRRCRACPSRSRCSRSSSTRRASKACTCAAARSRAAGCAGPTGPRISAPRCWASSRRRW